MFVLYTFAAYYVHVKMDDVESRYKSILEKYAVPTSSIAIADFETLQLQVDVKTQTAVQPNVIGAAVLAVPGPVGTGG